MSHNNLAIPGNSSTVTDTQFDDITTLRNAEERAQRVFDIISGRVNASLLASARNKLIAAFRTAEDAVAPPTRHTLPDDPE